MASHSSKHQLKKPTKAVKSPSLTTKTFVRRSNPRGEFREPRLFFGATVGTLESKDMPVVLKPPVTPDAKEDVKDPYVVLGTKSPHLRFSPKEVAMQLSLLEASDEKTSLTNMARAALGSNKRWAFKIGFVSSLSSNGSGYVNTVTACSTVTSTAEFTSLAALFDEFFVVRMESHYMPRSRYGVNLTYGLGLQQSNTGLGVVNIHHGATVYTTMSSMVPNAHFKMLSTGDPWKYNWENVENPNSDVATAPQTTPAIYTQAWCSTASTMAAAYTGQTQFLSQATGTILVASQVLGDVAISYSCLFRARV